MTFIYGWKFQSLLLAVVLYCDSCYSTGGAVCSRLLPWCSFQPSLDDPATFSTAIDRLPALKGALDIPGAPTECQVNSLVEYLCTESALNLGESCRWPGYRGHGSQGVVVPGSTPTEGNGLSSIEYLNPDVCGPNGFHGDLDPDVVFFYPVYKAPDMVTLSINTVQHPKHAFLVQVTVNEDKEFTDALLSLAAAYANICVVRYGLVVYATGSQELIHWPAMEWLTQLPNWHHYILMCGQSLPLHNISFIRGLLKQNRDASFLRHLRSDMEDNRRNTQRIQHACLPFCKRHRVFRNLTMRRTNALTDEVTKHWYKVGSWPVKILSRKFVEYAMTSPKAFQLFHFFKYTYISNEHLLPVLFSTAGPEMWGTVSDTWSSTLAIWPKLKMRNEVLTQEHESLWKGKNILFARKFDPQVDHLVIQKLVHGHSPHIGMPWDRSVRWRGRRGVLGPPNAEQEGITEEEWVSEGVDWTARGR